MPPNDLSNSNATNIRKDIFRAARWDFDSRMNTARSPTSEHIGEIGTVEKSN